MSQKQLLIDVLKLLNKLNVKYYLTGSWALSFYSQPRSTHDIDFVIDLKYEDVSRVFNTLNLQRFMITEKSIRDALIHRSQFQITDRETGFWIDFWIPKHSEFNNTVFLRRNRENIFGVEVWLPSLEDLIILKTIWSNMSAGSKLQRNDVRSMLKISEDINEEYLQKWINKLNLKEEYDKIQKTS